MEEKGELKMRKKYICPNCGQEIDEDELRVEVSYDDRGEFWGEPVSEKIVETFCPECGEEITEENDAYYYEPEEMAENEDDAYYDKDKIIDRSPEESEKLIEELIKALDEE